MVWAAFLVLQAAALAHVYRLRLCFGADPCCGGLRVVVTQRVVPVVPVSAQLLALYGHLAGAAAGHLRISVVGRITMPPLCVDAFEGSREAKV